MCLLMDIQIAPLSFDQQINPLYLCLTSLLSTKLKCQQLLTATLADMDLNNETSGGLMRASPLCQQKLTKATNECALEAHCHPLWQAFSSQFSNGSSRFLYYEMASESALIRPCARCSKRRRQRPPRLPVRRSEGGGSWCTFFDA